MNQRQASGSRGGQGAKPGGQGRDERDAPSIDLSEIKFSEKPAATLFSDIAERAAEFVSRARQEQNKSSQLRRFYDELVMWHEKVGADETRFTEHEPYIRMLKAKVAYSKGRGHVDANFEALFRKLIDEAKDARTLRQAKLFMEAFMAFYKVHRSK